MKFTRSQYLNGDCTHRQYYAQFVSPSTLAYLSQSLGRARLQAALKEDEDLNSIPLATWDSMPLVLNASMKEAGDSLTAAGKVCILKEAARQIAEK